MSEFCVENWQRVELKMASSNRAEELQLSIETTLYKISEVKLRETANYLKVKDVEKLSKRLLIKTIRDLVDEISAVDEGEEGTEDKILTQLKDIIAFINGDPPPLEKTVGEGEDDSDGDISEGEIDTEELEKAKQEYTLMQEDFLKMLQLQEEKIAEAKDRIQKLTKAPSSRISDPVRSSSPLTPSRRGREVFTSETKVPTPNSAHNVFRFKDLKIQGVISNEKNRLSFTSLNKQIDSAIEKSYPEKEIVDAVINAISPQLHLRSYLEGMKNLSLKELRQILRSHYCEKSATEAYQELTNVVQEPNETALNFLMRALKLRQHIMLASEEKESKIRYDDNLVQNVFINAVETGLADDAIRTRMRPFLEMSRVSDEVLIREINIAMTTESERSNKFGARKRPSKNNQASVQATEVADKPTTKETKANKQNTLLASLEAVQADVAMIKEAMNSQQSEKAGSTEKSRRPPSACESCIAKDETVKCDHCFICGSSEHFARGCKQRKFKQGNRGRLHQRDRV